ncbi:VWA domain-containing protein [Microbacterium sp. LWH10-1.2]|uniref:VWA domain-containing protein n=1 Tax=unclassified Microbacterium TaxID=2609290 RepID=UPI003138A17D
MSHEQSAPYRGRKAARRRRRRARIGVLAFAAVLSLLAFTAMQSTAPVLAQVGAVTTPDSASEENAAGGETDPATADAESADGAVGTSAEAVEPAVEGQIDGTITRAEAIDAGITPMSVPVPGPNQIVISVKVGGDRLPGGGMSDVDATGVAGVTLRLSNAASAPNTWSAFGWATCVSDAQGDCNFVVPVQAGATSAAGMNVNQQPYVHQISENTSGWHLAPVPLYVTGVTTTSYVFRLATTVTAGSTYRSTTFSPFMKASADPVGSQVTSSNGRWMVVRDNPPMVESCGLDVAVVMDLSSSIGAQLPAAKGALDTLINSLGGTPSNVALFNFNTNSPALTAGGTLSNYPTLMPVRTAAEAAVVKAIYAGWQIFGSTNWDQALAEVAAASPRYDVVVFITDGNPTIHSDGEWTDTGTWGNYVTTRSLEASTFSANAVKAEGARVVPFFVGTAPTVNLQNNLRLISGPTLGSDFFISADYTAAAQQLAEFANDNCQSSVVLKKRVVNPGFDTAGATKAQLDANSTLAPNWTFDASATSPTSIPGGTTVFTTGADGSVVVPLAFAEPATSGAVTIAERQQAGHLLIQAGGQNAYCEDANTGTRVNVTNVGTTASSNPGFTATATAGVALECVVYNQTIPPASVSVSKRVQDVSGQNERAGQGWTVGMTATATAGTATASPAAATQVTPANGTAPWTVGFGTGASRASVSVSETQQPGWTFVSGTCRVTSLTGAVRDQVIASAAGTTLTGIAPGDSVACTFVNRPQPGTVTWGKVDGDGTRLKGSSWTITGPGASGAVRTVDDCIVATCTGADTDARPGYLSVTGLDWGSYSLVETKAPAGYVLDATPRAFQVGVTAPASLTVSLGAIANRQQAVPTIPLTGGIGRDHLLIAGASVLLLTVGFALWQRRRRRFT